MKKWKGIIVHHSTSEWGTAKEIDKWHKERGWDEIGYNFVIMNGHPNYDSHKNNERMDSFVGSIEVGRSLEKIGAHAKGYNSDYIGICLIHLEKPYHEKMLTSLFGLVYELSKKYNIKLDNIIGHYEVEENKPDCPSIDMKMFRTGFAQYVEAQEKSAMLRN